MAKEFFEDRSFAGNIKVACKYDDGTVRYWEDSKRSIVSNIIAIVNSFSQQGYVLTLRQLHYQLVTRNWIVNHDTAYKKLGNILDDCRYAGLIDWNAIEDRGRQPYIPYAVDDIQDAINDTIKYYRLDRQAGQDKTIELWTEKDALSGILKRTTEKYHIQLIVNKGYTSSSAMYRSYERASASIREGKPFTILYFGDHDPSGLDMIRDIEERLLFFLCNGSDLKHSTPVNSWWDKKEYTLYDLVDEGYCSDNIIKLLHDDVSESVKDKLSNEFDAGRVRWYLGEHELFNVKPIGLTMEQIKKYKLPANPTKLTDSRSDKYVQQFGKTCWEVDALSPDTLTMIVERHIKEELEISKYLLMLKKEQDDKETLRTLIGNNDDNP